MLTHRLILAFSVAASAATLTYADLIESNSTDRLEQLTKTLAQGSYIDSADETPKTASKKMNVKLRTSTSSNSIDNPPSSVLAKKYTNTTQNYNSTNPYSWLIAHPLPNSRVSSTYGGRTMGGRAENHSGLDLAAPAGTPIYATGPGIVTKSGWGTGYGQYIEINHGNGYLTRYAHASRLIANVGDRVEAGEHIANVGCTGRCTGPHLHYEVVKDGQRKNPSSYLAMLD